jgi:hypothetical protein
MLPIFFILGKGRVGFLLENNDCWLLAARMGLAASNAELVTTKLTDQNGSSQAYRLKNLYKSGVRVFIGMNDGDKSLINLYPDATFVSPFAMREEIRNSKNVLPLTISGEYLADVAMRKVENLMKHNKYTKLVPVCDEQGVKDWATLFKPRVPLDVEVAEPRELPDDVWKNNSTILYLKRGGLKNFLDQLRSELRSTGLNRNVAEVVAPFAVFEQVLPFSEPIGVHTLFFLGDPKTEVGRRALFKRLERKTGHACPVTSAFVHDAALLAGSLLNGGDSVRGTTGVLNTAIGSTDISGDIATAYLRHPHDKTTLQQSNWILDGAYRVENEEVSDLALHKFKTIDETVFSRRTVADCHYFTPESLQKYKDHFPEVKCEKMETNFKVEDPLSFSTTWANFTSQNFLSFVVVPTAAGYEMTVTCADRQGQVEVACPGLESANDACTYRFTFPDSNTHKRDRRSLPGVGQNTYEKNKLEENNAPSPVYFDQKVLKQMEDRMDLYGNAGMYEQKRIRPGFLTKMIVAAAPNIMGCYGRLTGCMACVGYRITIFNDPLFCASACTAGVGSFCGAAVGSMAQKYFLSFSVVCTELFRQVRMSSRA